ncbi:MAG: hypothetical protein IPP57_27395 [Candidatus Obscuribacter sp.]|jgi:hypothetical protein|nr:hypothetical protein [Candidatus Obscuribacter sp.]MDQ5966026.1 hypothetical protein [Cyanobacteriota bacterium erpe_2018_sw_39hr_WHONDRS-SW48-000098_B_bin.30]MBK9622008.1 hypothetical protein [Candidatus Obscuribacter sp.]MBK9774507.1 hypothetical protein [Candidatus Obscuribacter sp.]MBL0185610.1 hypothetical protein [Candidatus Obscuribacter sp.]
MADTGGANRIELESQILCAALRASWADNDVPGQVNSCSELYQLFPDLVPDLRPNQKELPRNHYQDLGIDCDVPPSIVVAGFFKAAKQFLRQYNPKELRQEYYHVLDAGFVLRKPRLRLSHDLIVSRAELIASSNIPDDGTFELMAAQEVRPPQPLMVTTQPIVHQPLPMLVELMKEAQFVGAAEVQALTNQMRSFPDVSLAELVLSAGYVTESEMASLQLAEILLARGQINMGQFCVAMYDERMTGVKMAESLQVRGWLDTQSPTYRKD